MKHESYSFLCMEATQRLSKKKKLYSEWQTKYSRSQVVNKRAILDDIIVAQTYIIDRKSVV